MRPESGIASLVLRWAQGDIPHCATRSADKGGMPERGQCRKWAPWPAERGACSSADSARESTACFCRLRNDTGTHAQFTFGAEMPISGTSPVRVRTVTTVDLPAIARIHMASWHDAYRGGIPDEILSGRTVEGRSPDGALRSKSFLTTSTWPRWVTLFLLDFAVRALLSTRTKILPSNLKSMACT